MARLDANRAIASLHAVRLHEEVCGVDPGSVCGGEKDVRADERQSL